MVVVVSAFTQERAQSAQGSATQTTFSNVGAHAQYLRPMQQHASIMTKHSIVVVTADSPTGTKQSRAQGTEAMPECLHRRRKT
jgi:hypothetical protein